MCNYICTYLIIYFLVPSFIAQFNATEYEFDINIYSPIGTVVFEAVFIINPNVTVEYLSFDIINEEYSGDGDFLINDTRPPLILQHPFQSMYLLTITTGNLLDTDDIVNITFTLFACVNISTGGVLIWPVSDVILHKTGEY